MVAMRRLSLFAFLLLAGCRVTGTWDVVALEPDPAPDEWVLDTITLTDQGLYSATRMASTKRETTTGAYTFNGLELKLQPKDSEPRTYAATFGPGMTLVLKSDAQEPARTLRLKRRE